MCYRLAAELSDRIAAIAAVSGTLAIDDPKPPRPVPVMHFHGTADKIVPMAGSDQRVSRLVGFKSLEETINTWVRIDGCPAEPEVVKLPEKVNDGTSVTRRTYAPGKNGSEVVLFVIEGAGHTWPGQDPPLKYLGKSTKNISANDLIWEFFGKHPMK
jgi:polyhydroxybutyrate depolymerase